MSELQARATGGLATRPAADAHPRKAPAAVGVVPGGADHHQVGRRPVDGGVVPHRPRGRHPEVGAGADQAMLVLLAGGEPAQVASSTVDGTAPTYRHRTRPGPASAAPMPYVAIHGSVDVGGHGRVARGRGARPRPGGDGSATPPSSGRRPCGCANAEVRVERHPIAVGRPARRPARVSRRRHRVGTGLRVVLDGAIGFAATVEVGVDAAVALVDLAASSRTGHRRHHPAAGGAGRRAVPRHRRLVVPVPGRPGGRPPRPTRWRSSRRGAPACWPPPGVDHVTASVLAVHETKHYADLAGTRAHQRRVRVHPQVEALTLGDGDGGLRDPADAGPAGGTGVGVPHRRRLGLGGRARPAPGPPGREGGGAVGGAGHATTWSSTRPTCG